MSAPIPQLPLFPDRLELWRTQHDAGCIMGIVLDVLDGRTLLVALDPGFSNDGHAVVQLIEIAMTLVGEEPMLDHYDDPAVVQACHKLFPGRAVVTVQPYCHPYGVQPNEDERRALPCRVALVEPAAHADDWFATVVANTQEYLRLRSGGEFERREIARSVRRTIETNNAYKDMVDGHVERIASMPQEERSVALKLLEEPPIPTVYDHVRDKLRERGIKICSCGPGEACWMCPRSEEMSA